MSRVRGRTTRLARDQELHLSNSSKFRVKIRELFYFELGGIAKHLMTGPTGNSEFCFPSTLNVEGLEETKLTLSHGASH